MKKILIDIDGVVCWNTYLDELNKWVGKNYAIDDFKTYYIDDIIEDADEKYRFNASLKDVDLYEKAEMLPGAIETIEKLSKFYEVYFLSAFVNPYAVKESGQSLKFKYEFILRNFPFISPSHILFGGSKNIFDVDVQIDDKLKNLENKTPIKLLFTAYHNRHMTDAELEKMNIKRVSNWAEIEKILLK